MTYTWNIRVEYSRILSVHNRSWMFVKGYHTSVVLLEYDAHMKQTGMLVVSLRGVNFEFWSRLKGQCHEDFAVLGRFCAKILTFRL